MVRTAIVELGRGNIDDAFTGALWDHMDETQQVLIRVAETHPASDARLITGCRARHIERHHTLIGVPDVDHAVGVDIGCLDLQNAQQSIPILTQQFKGPIDVFALQIVGDDRLDGLLVDDAERLPFIVPRVFVIAQNEVDGSVVSPGASDNLT